MQKNKLTEIGSYSVSIALFVFIVIDPMGIRYCKTGTCPVSPIREIIGWLLLYISLSEVLFTPVLWYKKNIHHYKVLMVISLVLLSAYEVVMWPYGYLAIVNGAIIWKMFHKKEHGNEV